MHESVNSIEEGLAFQKSGPTLRCLCRITGRKFKNRSKHPRRHRRTIHRYLFRERVDRQSITHDVLLEELRMERVTQVNRRARDAALNYVDQLKKQPCADCGGHYPPFMMDFDHVRGESLVM